MSDCDDHRTPSVTASGQEQEPPGIMSEGCMTESTHPLSERRMTEVTYPLSYSGNHTSSDRRRFNGRLGPSRPRSDIVERREVPPAAIPGHPGPLRLPFVSSSGGDIGQSSMCRGRNRLSRFVTCADIC